MLEHDDKPFREETAGIKIFVVTALSLIVILTIVFVFAAYFFGIAGIFNLAGVHYDSLSSLVQFVIFYFLLGLAGDIVNKVFVVLLSKTAINGLAARFVKFLASFIVTWSIFSFLSMVMQSIHINTITQVIAASLIAIIELTVDGGGRKRNS
ncbi:YrvL family regulatory protein [Metabacillus sp. 84]|uniref:YrvL family regulatory protein n=1 Tax=Metabacillus sp. 84 TaxID=3404705 RepID=UPI003CE697E4